MAHSLFNRAGKKIPAAGLASDHGRKSLPLNYLWSASASLASSCVTGHRPDTPRLATPHPSLRSWLRQASTPRILIGRTLQLGALHLDSLLNSLANFVKRRLH